jgi:hypothetical protein
VETLVMLLVGVGLVWLVRHYRWCEACGKKVRERGHDLCPSCLAELEQAIEKMLKKRS